MQFFCSAAAGDNQDPGGGTAQLTMVVSGGRANLIHDAQRSIRKSVPMQTEAIITAAIAGSATLREGCQVPFLSYQVHRLC
jgi:hypothetical protein